MNETQVAEQTQIREKNGKKTENPLGVAPVNSLLVKFALPSIVAMLVGALYNIVDQIFIGNYVGELGNAATNIAFPLSPLCTATSLFFGIGGAAAFNLSMGAGKKDVAPRFVGNAAATAILIGIAISVGTEIFLEKLLLLFGSSEKILPYALDYTRITAGGFPFLIISVTGGHLIRADGKPLVAMLCNLTGAIVNTVLDAAFVIGCGWGMKGAALATVIAQVLSATIAVFHLFHFRTVRLSFSDFVPRVPCVTRIMNLGMSQGFNQIAMMLVQIVSNNTLKHYGALSVYGVEIPIAVVGIGIKLSQLYFSVCIGLSHALQPLASFNYGARNYKRTREAFKKARAVGSVFSVFAFLVFFIFPTQIISLFGKGSSPLYTQFAIKYMRIYLFCTFLNNIQPLTSTFFSAIGKPKIGLFLALTRQILFLLPLLLILPCFWGIEGMLFTGCIADFLAFIVSVFLGRREFSRKEYKTSLA